MTALYIIAWIIVGAAALLFAIGFAEGMGWLPDGYYRWVLTGRWRK